MSTCEDPGRLARDAYTYLHVPIVAGIIAVAVGDDLLIADPGRALHGVGLAMVLGGPALYLVGESLFRLRVTGTANAERLAVAAILALLAPLGSQISALALSATVAALLSALALSELRTGHVQPSASPTTTGRNVMKIVVIGGSGRIGTQRRPPAGRAGARSGAGLALPRASTPSRARALPT